MAKRAAAFYSYEYICPMEMWHDSLTPVVHTIQCKKLNKFEFDLETKMKERSRHWKHFFMYIYFKKDEGIKDLTSVQYNFFIFHFIQKQHPAEKTQNCLFSVSLTCLNMTTPCAVKLSLI